jgi:hypothetical protein
MLKKDNWWLGLGLGILLPAVLYAIIMAILSQWGTISEGVYVLKPSTSQLLALFSNMVIFRYYMVNLKFDKTGRGILLATIAYAAVYFYFHL